MKLLTSSQIHDWDAFTIKKEPISIEDLMERAALQAALSIKSLISIKRPILVLCGPGNNGADGLVIARLLSSWLYKVQVIECTGSLKTAALHQKKLALLHSQFPHVFHPGTEETKIPNVNGLLIIDALFGTSLRLPLPLLFTDLIVKVNNWKKNQRKSNLTEHVISIDIPSGMLADFSSARAEPVIQADRTLTFQCLKESFMLADTGVNCGFIDVLEIGLDRKYFKEKTANFIENYNLLDLKKCREIFKQRSPFSHKGTYGHALLLAGSKEKAGAAVLSAKGALHGGSGLVSAMIPESIRAIFLSQVPEAMAFLSANEDYLAGDKLPEGKFSALGIGPGLGKNSETIKFVKMIFADCKLPMVIDADALNIISTKKNWIKTIPNKSILSPHPGEFDRLAGESKTDLERIKKQINLSGESDSVIILKGFRTSVCFPTGELWFNTSGNPGMATGGSGDTLTGILTALLAQGYETNEAALLGVYMHGLAGDLAAAEHGETALSAGMLSEYLGRAFLQLEERN